jgi:macrolide-specific efflux system membrane fusion protein
MRAKLVAVAVLATVGVGALAYALGGVGANAAEIPEYLTAPATIGDVTDEIAATGVIAATSRTGVAFGIDPFLVDDGNAPASPATYAVTDVSVAIGDRVAAGAVLATADGADLERQLEAATNDLLTAKIDRNAAQDELDDAEDDEDSDRIYGAKKGLYAAENQVADAQARVDDLRAQLAGATLIAPVDGVVTEVSIRPGFEAPDGAAVIIDSTTFEVTTDVVEGDLVDVELGQTASVRVDAIDADLTGTVSAISPISGADTGSGVVAFPVTVTLDDVPAELRSGMSADVAITTASAMDVLTIPSAALLGANGDYRVRTLDADGNAVPTPVEVGLITAATAEITSGLSEGQVVVIGTASELAGTAPGGLNGFGGVAVPGGGPIMRELGPGGGPNVQVGP